MTQDRKPNVLWVSEASFLNTGFSVLSKEILERLLKTWKFHIYEFGSYAKTSDPRKNGIEWPFFGAMPEDHEQELVQRYSQSQTGQFGETLFEKVCLQVRPDIVIASRDFWMDEFILRSAYRHNFKIIWMPTIDGFPQKSEWMDKYSQEVDRILTYTQFGKDQLLKQQPDMEVFDIVRPGVDHELYKPMDKIQCRRELGVPEDAHVITSVMRNQRRKLFPDLIETFADYLKYCIEKEDWDKANKTYLYLHTSYPDVGFDIGRHIIKNGVANRVLMTYYCRHCGNCYADFFRSEMTTCKRCGNLSAFAPNTSYGVTREQLAKVHNISDLYVQFSISEGYGIPIAEAKSCGVPALAVDNSAMTEHVKNMPGCDTIKVKTLFHEPIIETEQERALPDHKDAVRKIYNFFCTKPESRIAYAKQVRQDVIDNHSFDRAAKVFEKALDSLSYDESQKTTWLNPDKNFLHMPSELPQFRTHSDMVDWLIVNVIKKPELLGRYFRNQLIKGLNTGVLRMDRHREKRMNPEECVNMFQEMVNKHNYWEDIRYSSLIQTPEDAPEEVDWMVV